MATRVNDADVKEILDTSISTTVFIKAANLIVNEHLSGQGLSNDQLKEIERWLSAHLACVRDPRVAEEAFGDARAKYQGITGLGLDATMYGQQVRLLDSTGRLSRVGKQAVYIKAIREFS
jgi:hypothetical protein